VRGDVGDRPARILLQQLEDVAIGVVDGDRG
jgi:hypothetical protein